MEQHHNGILGMELNYVCDLACLRDVIPRLDFSNFTNKEIAPPKPHHVLESSNLVKFPMTWNFI